MNNPKTGSGKEKDSLTYLFKNFNYREFMNNLKQEWKDLNDFFIEEERKKELSKMGWIKRWIFFVNWSVRSLFHNLNPIRQMLFVIGMILILISGEYYQDQTGVRVNVNLDAIGIIILVFLLMLELKDKLIAKQELQAGRVVQVALMPDKNPQIPGWDICMFSQPANDVGGDLLDFIEHGTDKFGLVIGDIAGKGLRAALLMAKLQTIIRSLAPDYSSLSDLAVKINDVFHRNSLPSIFASLFYVEVKPDSGSINYFNAGHIPPIIVRQGICEELSKGDPAIGILHKVIYAEKTLELQKGDFLLAYSDGLSEAMNEKDEQFGTKKIINLLPGYTHLSANKITDKLLYEIKNFTGSARQSDDISIIILKRTI